METHRTYVYFALTGDDFNPEVITSKLEIQPTRTWKKGDKGKYKPILEYACWELSTKIGAEYIDIDKLVDEIIDKLFDKIHIINELKLQLHLNSILEIILYVDTNEKQTTPALGHNHKVIEFLYKTNTATDVDIYRFTSIENANEQNAR